MFNKISESINEYFYPKPFFLDNEEEYIKRFMEEDTISLDEDKNPKKSLFKHLDDNDVTYLDHFRNSMGYCFTSLKSSVFFFIHAFIPDLFEYNGSKNISNLNSILIKNKRRMTH